MPARNETLTDRLSRYREINITVTGRKSGRAISNPVWFVLQEDQLYLLPVSGSDTQWYKNVLKNSLIRIDARGIRSEEHTSELQSRVDLVCRLLLEKKKKKRST